MAQFIVSANQLEQKKNELEGKKRNYESLINQLESEARSLYTMWDGDAKESFKTSLTEDIKTLKAFIIELDDFIKTLSDIIQTYRTTEQKNAALAASK